MTPALRQARELNSRALSWKLLIHHGALGDLIVSLPAINAFHHAYEGPLLALGIPNRLRLIQHPRGPIESILHLDAQAEARLLGSDQPLPDWLSGPGLHILAFTHQGPLAEKLKQQPRAHLLPPAGQQAQGPVAQDLVRKLPPRLQQLAPAWPSLTLSPEDQAEARQTLARLGLNQKPYALLLPGAGHPAKRWPIERFVTLAEQLKQQKGWPSLFALGPAELDAPPAQVKNLTDRIADGGHPCLTMPALPLLAALIKQSTLVVTNDSGPAHMAAALSAPGLTLFGPSSPELWQPHGPLGPAPFIQAPDKDLNKLHLSRVWDHLATIPGACEPYK